MDWVVFSVPAASQPAWADTERQGKGESEVRMSPKAALLDFTERWRTDVQELFGFLILHGVPAGQKRFPAICAMEILRRKKTPCGISKGVRLEEHWKSSNPI